MPTEDVSYRDIPSLQGYMAGSDGSIWTARERYHEKGLPGSKSRIGDSWREMNQSHAHKSRYPVVSVSMPGWGRARNFFVHRLVLEAFVGPCPEGMECCHGDGNPANNSLSNLRWDTGSANQADRRKHGTAHLGEKNKMSLVTEDIVRAIRRRYEEGGITLKAIGDIYGITESAVWRIIKRRNWSHVV